MHIEEILRRVLEELERQGTLSKETTNKRRLMALKVSEDRREQVQKVFGAAYEISWKDRLDEEFCYDRILLGTTEVNTLFDLAHGRNPEEGRLMEYVLMGVPVEVLAEGLVHRRMASTSPPGLQKLYEGYVKQMESLGIALRHMEQQEKGAESSKEKKEKRRLIREAEVVALAKAGGTLLEVHRGTIITPLAADAIRYHNIEVRST